MRHRIVEMYRETGAHEKAIELLFDIAQRYESDGDAVAAQKAVRSAQELGADPMRCAQTLATFALLADDTEGALQQLELVAKHAQSKRDIEATLNARRQMLLIAPGRGVVALAHARALEAMGDLQEAIGFLAAALVDDQRDLAPISKRRCARSWLNGHRTILKIYKRCQFYIASKKMLLAPASNCS